MLLIFPFVAGGLALGILMSVVTGNWIFILVGYALGTALPIVLTEILTRFRSKRA